MPISIKKEPIENMSSMQSCSNLINGTSVPVPPVVTGTGQIVIEPIEPNPPSNGAANNPVPQNFSERNTHISDAQSAGKDAPQENGAPKHMDNASCRGIFGWTTIDDVNVPYLFRDQKQYVAVRMVELKLLSRYPSCYPEELKNRSPLMSHYITENEARLLNEINVDHCNYEYGKQQFTVQDLIVKLGDFKEFLDIVKKHFPSHTQPLQTMTAPVQEVTKVDGGWIQINNTVVPYVLRSNSKYVPLSVLRYAAGLLTEVAVEGQHPTDEECAFLNQSCKDAGLKFTFVKSTRLLMLEVVKELCVRTGPVLVIELPNGNPFIEAEYRELPTLPSKPADGIMFGQVSRPSLAPQMQAHPNVRPQYRPPPPYGAQVGPRERMPWNNGYWMGPHMGIYPGQQAGGAIPMVNKVNPNPTGSSTETMPQNVNINVNVNVQQQHQKSTDRSSNSNTPQPSPKTQVVAVPSTDKSNGAEVNNNQDIRALARLSQMASPLESVDKLSGPIGARRSSSGGSACISPSQITTPFTQSTQRFAHPNIVVTSTPGMFHVPMGGNRPGMPGPRPGWQTMAVNPNEYQNFVQIIPQRFPTGNNPGVPPPPLPPFQALPKYKPPAHENQHDSVKIRPLQFHNKTISCLIRIQDPYALVEAAGRVYFPNVQLKDFIDALENHLHVNIEQLKPDEEKAFINFYGLPITNLMCNKIVGLKELDHHLPQLNYMFREQGAMVGQAHDPARPVPHTTLPQQTTQTTSGAAAVSAQNQTHAVLREHLGKSKRSAVKDISGPASKMRRGLEAAVARLKQSHSLGKERAPEADIQEGQSTSNGTGGYNSSSPALASPTETMAAAKTNGTAVTETASKTDTSASVKGASETIIVTSEEGEKVVICIE